MDQNAAEPGPTICHVLDGARRWDRLGSESALFTGTDTHPILLRSTFVAVPEPRPTKIPYREAVFGLDWLKCWSRNFSIAL